MKRVCAWCGEILGYRGGEDGPITHGICKSCAAEMFQAIENRNFQSYLDRFHEPILLVDSDMQVKTANERACDLLGKDLKFIEDLPGGNVIECEYAYTPEGCGRSIHCQSCAIRHTVQQTHQTNEAYIRQTAFQNIRTNEGTKKVLLNITTEKSGGIIFLRIDEMGEAKDEEEINSS